ncbi:MAG: hypothetical protein COB67_04995 [SAR324 cluster bacterium]|uniref:Uncharacterized protein n=1 Tax=SAR324 cluster bacterium TaxID=2024889 RepID=A0A2A4T7D3_9DELT|nr:MAG: hypothetical protein COB67_04995 [SAR324 cluster bacterium]
MTDFWKRKTLDEMTPEEWESLCDGCGVCCLHQIEDEDTGTLYSTWVGCQYLDTKACRCTRYQERSELVKGCVTLTPELSRNLYWIPPTCAYRLLAEGKPLPEWHPLVSGDPESVHEAGISVQDKVIPEQSINLENLTDYVIDDDDDEDEDEEEEEGEEEE